jgi:ATP-dependent Lon protease
VAQVQSAVRLPNGAIRVLVDGLGVARLGRVASSKGVLYATLVAPSPVATSPDRETATRARRLTERFEEYAGLQRRVPPEIVQIAATSEDGPGRRT